MTSSSRWNLGVASSARVAPRAARAWWLATGAIVLAGLALRATALDFGLPAVYNPDEIAIVSRALAFAKGDLNPHNFLYPTFFFYVLFAWIGLSFVVGRLSGQVASLAAFQDRFFVDPSGVYLAGRWLGALCGALTAGATAVLGRTWFDAPTGLAAAALLAAAPTAVMDAHYVKHDVPATLVVVLALWRLARCWPEGGAAAAVPSRALLSAAAVCGIAWSTHYYTVFLAFPLAATVIQARRGGGWRAVAGGLAAAGAAGAAVFLALSPFLLVEPGTAWRDVVANRQIVVDRAAGAGPFPYLGRYVELLATAGVTLPVAALSAIGTALLCLSDPRRALLPLSFALPFVLFISHTVPATRYLNPVLPVAALMAAWALRRLAAALMPARQGAVLAVLTALSAAVPLSDSLRVVRFFGQDDTRTLAARAITAQVPDGATVLVQPYSVQLAQSREGLEEALRERLGSLDALPTRSRLRLAVSPWPRPSYRVLWLGDGGLDEDKIYIEYADLRPDPLAALRRRGVGYVVLKRDRDPDAAAAPLAAALARGARRLASVSPYREETAAGPRPEPFLHNVDAVIHRGLRRPGPVVDVFALD